MSELIDSDGENLAVRSFLSLYGNLSEISTGKMHIYLTECGFTDHTPDWAIKDNPLTKEGAQEWLRFLFNKEHILAPIPILELGDRVVLSHPGVWQGFGCDIDAEYVVTGSIVSKEYESGRGIRVFPLLQPNHPHGYLVWYDSTHFKRVIKEEEINNARDINNGNSLL